VSLEKGKENFMSKRSDITAKRLVCCVPGDTVSRAAQLMEQYQLRRLPVVDEDGRLVGIISEADLATRVNSPDKTTEVVIEILQS
jgi:CBS domain-containing protein